MTMTKKYAICNVHAVTGNHITILDIEEYCTAMCDIDIIEESDDYYYIRNLYNEKYDNRYVTGEWLRNNGYIVEDVSTFAGAGKRYINKIKNINVEIVLVNDSEGYHLTLKNHGRTMEYTDNLWHLTIEKFNILINIFNI
jgi:hypothetical protein